MMAGNSNCHQRWGLNFDHKNNLTHLAPCAICRRSLLNRTSSTKSRIQYYKRKRREAKTNKMCCLLWDGSQVSKHYTYGRLRRLLQKGFRLSDEGATIKVMKNYFKKKGLNDELLEVYTNSKTMPMTNESSMRVYPAVWSNPFQSIPLHQLFLDVPMHCLFLGITKSITASLRRYIDQSIVSIPLEKSISKVFHYLHKMKLKSLQLLPFKQTKGLLSENYVAIAKLFNWIASSISCSDIDHHAGIQNDFDLQTIHTWNRAICKRYLHMMGMKKKGTLDELRDRILMASTVTLSQRLRRVVALSNIMCTFHQLMCIIMSTPYTPSNIDDATLHILQLLTLQNEYSEGSIIRKLNFLSLLNYPDAMREWGPLRSLWEGSIIGEKFLSILKPLIYKNSSAWEKSLIVNTYAHQSTNRMAEILFHELRLCQPDIYSLLGHLEVKQRCNRKNRIKYESFVAFVRDVLQEELPVSCLYSNTKTYVELKDGFFLEIVKVDDDATPPIHLQMDTGNIITYCRVLCMPERIAGDIVMGSNKYTYGIMLPYIASKKPLYYHYITLEWMTS